MSPRSMEEILDEQEAEGLDVSEARAAWAASPLRKEREEAIKRAETAETLYRQAVAANQLRDLGVTIKPTALVLPADLDWTDTSKVRQWAVDAGLPVTPEPPPAPPEPSAAGHDRITDAVQGIAPPGRPDMHDALANAKSEAEVMALLRGSGVPTSADISE